MLRLNLLCIRVCYSFISSGRASNVISCLGLCFVAERHFMTHYEGTIIMSVLGQPPEKLWPFGV